MTTVLGDKHHADHMGEKREVAHNDYSSSDKYEPHRDEETADRFVDIDDGFDPVLLRKTIRKVDFRLIPILSAMYCISLIDRTNLSLARAANDRAMNTELALSKGNTYSLATVIFFVPYIILEIPSQIGLRRYGARWWLGGATILWGIVMLGMGFVKNSSGLIALRAVLGIFEATLFPGAAYLIACWYPRRQMAVRTATFYLLSIVVSGLGSILAYGISQMNGTAGFHGWRWIFIIQGILTVVIGAMGILLIVDFPDKATFLTAEQQAMVITRIQRDRADSVPDGMTMAKFWQYFMTPKIWVFGYCFGSSTVGSYSLAYFLPQILGSMGFTNAQSQLLVAPPYVYAILPILTTAFISDRFRLRPHMIAFNAMCLIIGTCMYSQVDKAQKATRYAGIFISVGACNANVPLIVSWSQTSIRSQSKRGYTSALVVAWGGIGGILSGVAFLEKEAKMDYPTGVFLTIGMNAGVIVLVTLLRLWFNRQNKRADRGEIVLEGDPNFRYNR